MSVQLRSTTALVVAPGSSHQGAHAKPAGDQAFSEAWDLYTRSRANKARRTQEIDARARSLPGLSVDAGWWERWKIDHQGLSPRTRNMMLQSCKQFLGFCERLGYCGNGLKDVQAERDRGTVQKIALAPWQARQLVAQGIHDVLWASYILTGMRRGELLESRWSWLQGDVWRLPAECTKTRQARDIHIGPKLREMLGDGPPEERIFPHHPRTVVRWLAEDCRKAGVPHVCVHELRHTTASLLNRAGATHAELKLLMGHSMRSADITLRYCHFEEDQLRELAARIERMVL
jgi:integrase